LVSKEAVYQTQQKNGEDEEAVDEDDHQPGEVGLEEVAQFLVDVDGNPAEEVRGLDHVEEGNGRTHEEKNENNQEFNENLYHFLLRFFDEAVAPVDVNGVDEVVDAELLVFGLAAAAVLGAFGVLAV